MSQLTYPLEQPIGLNGQLADTGNNDVLTYNNPSAVIPFGRALEKIAEDVDGVQLPDDGSANIVGISLRELNESVNYPIKSAVSVLRKGRVLVEVEEAVTPESVVYYRHTARAQVQTIVFDADLIIGNKVNLKINGVAMSEVTFDTSHANTMSLLDTAITAMEGVANVTFNSRTLTVTSDLEITLAITNISVTSGMTQANGVVTQTVSGVPSTDLGKLRASPDESTAAVLTGAKFITSASANGVAVVDLNLP